MTGLSFLSGLWYLHEPFAHQWKGIIQHRLAQGRDPIPATIKAAAGKSDERQERWNQRWKNQSEVIDELYDEDGFYDPLRGRLYEYRKAGGGSVAVVPIEGSMARVGFCGSGGNEETARILQLAAAHPKIKGVVLKMNTPGGTVDSTRMLADVVATFSKPILVWTPFCASAGYYVASQAAEIWLEDQTVSQVGSIGVLMVYVDQSEALAREGTKITIYRADGSEKKAQINGIEPITPDQEAEIRQSLNDCRTEFLGYVRRGRAGKLTSDEAFTGEMFGREKALAHGLVDRIGSLQACIYQALQLAA
ncbi:S49 family peptidase [Larkinella sp. GY13]|uniref:S49 family peptidase n=1 Tax=Larkinella sp. GY13 TaxID=3453720 RepID=UPI003EE99520